MYVRLFDLIILREKVLKYLQTVETLIRRCTTESESALFATYRFGGLQTKMG